MTRIEKPAGASPEVAGDEARAFEVSLDLDVEPHEAVRYYLTEIQVCVLPIGHPNYDWYVLRVARHPRLGHWFVKHGALILNENGSFGHWTGETRGWTFEYEEAIQRAALLAPHLLANGVTALQALEIWKASRAP